MDTLHITANIVQAISAISSHYTETHEDPVTDNTFSYYLGGKLIAIKKGADLSYVLQDHPGRMVMV